MSNDYPDITQDDLNRAASGMYPHERGEVIDPDIVVGALDAQRRELLSGVAKLGLAHNLDAQYNAAITDVIALIKGREEWQQVK